MWRRLAIEHEIDAGESRTAKRLVGAAGDVLHVVGLGTGQFRGADVVRAADLVAGLVVESVLLLGPHLDHGQRLAVEQGDGELPAVDVTLEEHPVVVAERRHDRLGHVGARCCEPDPERRALRGGLDHQRKAKASLDLLERVGGAELAERRRVEGDRVGRRDPGAPQQVLRKDLVHAVDAGGDAGPGVGDAEDLE